MQQRRRAYFRRKGLDSIGKTVARRRQQSNNRKKAVAGRMVASLRNTCHFGPGGGMRRDAYTAEECEEMLPQEHEIPKNRQGNAFKSKARRSQGKKRVAARRKERKELRKRLGRKRKRTTRELNKLPPPGAPAPKRQKAPRP